MMFYFYFSAPRGDEEQQRFRIRRDTDMRKRHLAAGLLTAEDFLLLWPSKSCVQSEAHQWWSIFTFQLPTEMKNNSDSELNTTPFVVIWESSQVFYWLL